MIEWFYGRPFQKTTRCKCPTQDLEPSKRRKTIWDKRLVSRATLHIGQVLMQKLMNKYKNTITRPPTSSHYKGRLKWLRVFFGIKKVYLPYALCLWNENLSQRKKPTLMFVLIEINVMLFTLNDCRSILPQLHIFIWNFMLKIRKLSFVYLIIASLQVIVPKWCKITQLSRNVSQKLLKNCAN